ncbi:MAG: succinyl-diaminopimelate desuccinylase [Burkholderiaceae bacterium]|jgi:succinyl-diaminopimelate desuccinylase|nr:succinyl-diaminopimelate desuccinylase [Burkholderiaceae bacterium]
MSRTLALAEQLIARPSVTPDDGGCQRLLGERLAALGFALEPIERGPLPLRVSNLWAFRASAHPGAKTVVLAGHTDVVPPGPPEQWRSPPFEPSQREGRLYGRGACDMKTSLAAFVVAIEEFLAAHPDPRLNLALLLTSDEEGPAVDGTVAVCDALAARGQRFDYCLVGEPSSVHVLGDTLKNGRRGTLSGRLTVKGIQGHIAYPKKTRNPVHLLAPALAQWVAINAAGGWDAGNAFFEPTSWQISNIHAGTGASNVVPGEVVVDFNFRFCTESTPESLQQRIHETLDAQGLKRGVDYTLAWTVGGLPFLTEPGALVDAVRAAIHDETGVNAELSTSGGTSDARFIADLCDQVIEFGPVNDSIHKIDEHIGLDEIDRLTAIYRRVLERLDRMN